MLRFAYKLLRNRMNKIFPRDQQTCEISWNPTCTANRKMTKMGNIDYALF